MIAGTSGGDDLSFSPARPLDRDLLGGGSGNNSGASPDLPPEGAGTGVVRKYAFAILCGREQEEPGGTRG